MLKNACLNAKLGADTAENEGHFAKSLQKKNLATTLPRCGRGRISEHSYTWDEIATTTQAAGGSPG